jgi:hypothetical protein
MESFHGAGFPVDFETETSGFHGFHHGFDMVFSEEAGVVFHGGAMIWWFLNRGDGELVSFVMAILIPDLKTVLVCKHSCRFEMQVI